LLRPFHRGGRLCRSLCIRAGGFGLGLSSGGGFCSLRSLDGALRCGALHLEL